ncbi:MAG: cell division protein FtsZ, partial [Shewanella sp.]
EEAAHVSYAAPKGNVVPAAAQAAPAPAPSTKHELDYLDIPAFLRKQAD